MKALTLTLGFLNMIEAGLEQDAIDVEDAVSVLCGREFSSAVLCLTRYKRNGDR